MRLPASTKAGGVCVGLPDVCLVPAQPGAPVPTAFTNVAECAAAVDVTGRVLVENMPAITDASKIPNSSGDEAGSGGGVISRVTRGRASFKSGSAKVFVEGKKVATSTSITSHNGSNANQPAGLQVVPSQGKIFVET